MKNELREINLLPAIAVIKKRAQGLALLDAIMMPEWEYRYFSFNNNWDVGNTESMASMRDGSECEYFIHFSLDGVAGKVFDGSQLSDQPLALSALPKCFDSFKSEVAFKHTDATFYFWKQSHDSAWFSSPNNLKAYPLLAFLAKGIDAYWAWAEYYYEREIDKETLSAVFNALSITDEQLNILNADLVLKDLIEDIAEILG